MAPFRGVLYWPLPRAELAPSWGAIVGPFMCLPPTRAQVGGIHRFGARMGASEGVRWGQVWRNLWAIGGLYGGMFGGNLEDTIPGFLARGRTPQPGSGCTEMQLPDANLTFRPRDRVR
jgi:hypothetical protein